MKVPIEWLKEYVDIKGVSTEELSERLSLSGSEVEHVIGAAKFNKVVVGEVINVKKHPNADKLNVANVNVGKDVLQIVCGAPNLKSGQKVPVALVGAKLGDFEISKANLRGIESFGMICSEKELDLGDDHSGIMVLDKNIKPGTEFGEAVSKSVVLDFDITPNRADCYSIIGMARETAATLNRKLNLSAIKLKETSKTKMSDLIGIEIQDKELCPRYVAKIVKGVKITDSPEWMQKRLIESGMRPINNIVDISNYVMLEYGQPLHFFDLNKLKKSQIIVRKAKDNEVLETLDGVKRKLTKEMLVIADAEEPVAIAGVMGSASSEVDEKTTDILIEAAIFNKTNIRKTSRNLGLRTEASTRFEKGLPLTLPEVAIDRAAQLLGELAKGEILSGKVDKLGENIEKVQILLRHEKLKRILGIDISLTEVTTILNSLGFVTDVDKSKEEMIVTVPWWRTDVKIEEDLFEEVGRIYGYKNFQLTLPDGAMPIVNKNEIFELSRQIKNFLAGAGLSEVINYSFISKSTLVKTGEKETNVLKIANPLSPEYQYMRNSLSGNLLNNLAKNQNDFGKIQIFEIGNVFIPNNGELPRQITKLGVAVKSKTKNDQNYYDLKGIVELLMAKLNITDYFFKTESGILTDHNRTVSIFASGKRVGYFGETSINIEKSFDLNSSAGICEIDLEELSKFTGRVKTYTETSKYPKIIRDISAVFSKDVEAGKVVNEIKKIDDLIQKTEVVDIYRGKPLSNDEKSVTLRVEFQSMKKTLTDEEIDSIMDKITKKIVGLGGNIRGVKKD